MSKPQEPKPAKLVIGLLMKDSGLFGEVAGKLSARFGDVDLISAWLPFDYTSYYEKEMGAPLCRRMLAFRRLIRQDALAGIKAATNEFELACSYQGKRRVNIDPGYLVLERFVLASGKNFAHRIYLGQGIYADLTLIYRKGAFLELPWTYPDYADQPILGFLAQVRRKYRVDLTRLAGNPGKPKQ
jgi:Domain of unknown function (DUF4416)